MQAKTVRYRGKSLTFFASELCYLCKNKGESWPGHVLELIPRPVG